MRLLEQGRITPIRLNKTFHITEMESALRYFGQGQHIGKVVLTYGPSDNKITIKGARQPRGIDSQSSYLLVGCHGGLGHSMADSLIERGARNLVFLGRSSETKREIASFCKRARSNGVNIVTIQGDASKMEDVERAVAQAISMGPLKGVVHAAMVLQDAFFDTMTLAQFNIAVRPKVHGALNLHRAPAHPPRTARRDGLAGPDQGRRHPEQQARVRGEPAAIRPDRGRGVRVHPAL